MVEERRLWRKKTHLTLLPGQVNMENGSLFDPPSWLDAAYLKKNHPELKEGAAEKLVELLSASKEKVIWKHSKVTAKDLAEGGEYHKEVVLISGAAFTMDWEKQLSGPLAVLQKAHANGWPRQHNFVHKGSQYEMEDHELKLVQTGRKAGGRKMIGTTYRPPPYSYFLNSNQFKPYSVSLEKHTVTALTDEEDSCVQGLSEGFHRGDIDMYASFPLVSVGDAFTHWHMDHLRMSTLASLVLPKEKRSVKIENQGQGMAGKIWILLKGDGAFRKGKSLAAVPKKQLGNNLEDDKEEEKDEEEELESQDREWTITAEDLSHKSISAIFQPEGTTLYIPGGSFHSVLTVYSPGAYLAADRLTLLLGTCMYEPKSQEQARQAVYSLNNEKTGKDRRQEQQRGLLYQEIVAKWNLQDPVPEPEDAEEVVKRVLGLSVEKKTSKVTKTYRRENAKRAREAKLAKKLEKEEILSDGPKNSRRTKRKTVKRDKKK